ncbi:hypothetical protein V7S79_04970 [Aquirufa sp. ROCK-SH2]
MEWKQFFEGLFSLETFSELHPLFVHFPIGLLLLLGFFSLLPKSKRERLEPSFDYLLKAGVFFSLLSCVSGYLLANLEEMKSSLVQQHQWFGISTTLIYLAIIFIKKYRNFSLPIATIFLLITFYLGTILTHGSFKLWKENVIHSVQTLLEKPKPKSLETISAEPEKSIPFEKEDIMEEEILPLPMKEANVEAINALKTQGIVVTKMEENSQGLALNFVNVSSLDPSILAQMMSLKDQIVSLRLNNIPLTKQDLQKIALFKNLQNLQLANTHLSDESLLQITQLPFLEELNVYNNPLTDKGVLALQKCKVLKKLFVWKTKVSQSALAELQKNLPALRIEAGFQVLSKPDSIKK